MRLLNISNHPSASWADEQKKGWDVITDIPFPAVSPSGDSAYVGTLARLVFKQVIRGLYEEYRRVIHWGPACPAPERDRRIVRHLLSNVVCHVAGEYCMFYALVSLIRRHGGKCVVACSERQAVETAEEDGSVRKSVIFTFRRWREVK